jgi:hypothetical protein
MCPSSLADSQCSTICPPCASQVVPARLYPQPAIVLFQKDKVDHAPPSVRHFSSTNYLPLQTAWVVHHTVAVPLVFIASH